MLKNLQDRIAAFRAVRDIPYYIATRGEADFCCSTKASMLEKKLQLIGFECRHALCRFRWEKLNLPAPLLRLEHEAIASHEYLEVFVSEEKRWILVDPTWDSALARVLPINEWDGSTSTPCAVPVESICTDGEMKKIFADCADPQLVRGYFEKYGPFLRAVNEYLAQARR